MDRDMSVWQKSRITDVLKGTVKLILWDWSTLLLFEVAYKFILFMFSAYYKNIFIEAMNEAGMMSLTGQNWVRLLTVPSSFFLLLFLILLLIAAAYIEIAGVLLYLKDGRYRRKRGIIHLFSETLKQLPRLVRVKHTGLIPFLLLIVPLTGFFLSIDLGWPRLPAFIAESLLNRPFLAASYATLAIGLFCLLFRYLFCLQGMLLSNKAFTEAGRECRALLRGRKVKTLVFLCIWLLMTAAAAAAFYLIALTAMLLSAKLFYGGEQEIYAFWFAYSKLSRVGAALLSIYRMVCSMGIMTFLYYRYRDEEESLLRENNAVALQRYRERREWLAALMHASSRGSTETGRQETSGRGAGRRVAAGRVLLCLLLVVSYAETALFPPSTMQGFSDAQVVAHRGGSYYAPENTLAALQVAKRSGAAYAEIDVRLTRDGVPVVSHDANLKRMTGVDRNIWETDVNEISEYDAGAWFSADYSGERIPTWQATFWRPANVMLLRMH